jgi:Lon protease-like protein
MSDHFPELKNFGGVARLFPLPNVVLFPNLLQALHIFEPRYRQMTEDALAGDRMIAMVLLRPGWEPDYEGKPPIHSVACLGKILAEQRLPDGRFNLQLRGLSRARILGEVADLKPYRSARMELMAETNPVPAGEEPILRKQMLEAVPIWSAGRPHTREMFGRLLKSDLPFGTVSDVLAFALPIPVELKQELLEECSVHNRSLKLIQYLQSHTPATPEEPSESEDDRQFPPDFSAN